MNLHPRAAVAATAFLFATFICSTRPIHGQPQTKTQDAAKATALVGPGGGDVRSFRIEVPTNVGNSRALLSEMRDGKRLVLEQGAVRKASNETLAAMDSVAKTLVYPITHAEYYIPPEPTKNELRPPLSSDTLQAKFEDLERYVLVPTRDRKLNVDQSDYIQLFGAALDRTIREVLNPKDKSKGNPPNIVQVNAARMLSIAARSGAAAHYPTILELVSDPNTRPEILIYAIQAAEGMLAAYDPIKAGTNNYANHTIKDPQTLKLVLALESIIQRTKPYGPPPRIPGAKLPKAAAPTVDPKTAPKDAKGAAPMRGEPKPAPKPMDDGENKQIAGAKASNQTAGQMEADILAADQVRTVKFFRRAAVRALSQVRYPQFVDPNTNEVARPLATLAKIAIGDPSITTSPGSDEVAYAVMGLCNLYRVNEVNNDVLCDLIAQGVMNFATKKAANPQDKTLQWKRLSAMLATSLTDWTKAPSSKRNERKITELANLLIDKILTPLDRSGTLGAAPNFDAVARWREQNVVQKLQLYAEVPTIILKPGFIVPQS